MLLDQIVLEAFHNSAISKDHSIPGYRIYNAFAKHFDFRQAFSLEARIQSDVLHLSYDLVDNNFLAIRTINGQGSILPFLPKCRDRR